MNNSNELSISTHWDGSEYRKISFPQNTINKAFLEAQKFQGNELVLDIGCGDGTTSSEILSQIPQGSVLGIDASASMIDAAKQSFNHNKLSFQVLNAHAINFSQQFDLVTSFFCMQWVQKKSEVIKKIYDSLNYNGRFLMIVPLPHPHLPEIRNVLTSSSRWKKYFENYNDPLVYINDVFYKKYAEDAGFVISQYVIDPIPVRFDNKIDFLNFMRQMTPHCSCIPNRTEINLFMSELLESYFKVYPIEKDGSCQLTFNLVNLVALKLNITKN